MNALTQVETTERSKSHEPSVTDKITNLIGRIGRQLAQLVSLGEKTTPTLDGKSMVCQTAVVMAVDHTQTSLGITDERILSAVAEFGARLTAFIREQHLLSQADEDCSAEGSDTWFAGNPGIKLQSTGIKTVKPDPQNLNLNAIIGIQEMPERLN